MHDALRRRGREDEVGELLHQLRLAVDGVEQLVEAQLRVGRACQDGGEEVGEYVGGGLQVEGFVGDLLEDDDGLHAGLHGVVRAVDSDGVFLFVHIDKNLFLYIYYRLFVTLLISISYKHEKRDIFKKKQ